MRFYSPSPRSHYSVLFQADQAQGTCWGRFQAPRAFWDLESDVSACIAAAAGALPSEVKSLEISHRLFRTAGCRSALEHVLEENSKIVPTEIEIGVVWWIVKAGGSDSNSGTHGGGSASSRETEKRRK